MQNIDTMLGKSWEHFAVNSLEYFMSLIFSFSPMANTLYTAKNNNSVATNY